MARLPYVDPASAPEQVRELLERLPVKLNIFRMMAHATTDFRPLVGLGSAILARQKLSPKLRELAIVRAVLRFTTEVLCDVRASEATFAEAARHLSAQEIVELIVTVGYYMLIA